MVACAATDIDYYSRYLPACHFMTSPNARDVGADVSPGEARKSLEIFRWRHDGARRQRAQIPPECAAPITASGVPVYD